MSEAYKIKMKAWTLGGSIEIDGSLRDPDVRKIIQQLLDDSKPPPDPELVAKARALGFPC